MLYKDSLVLILIPTTINESSTFHGVGIIRWSRSKLIFQKTETRIRRRARIMISDLVDPHRDPPYQLSDPNPFERMLYRSTWMLQRTLSPAPQSICEINIAMEDYRYHDLRPLISYFPCHLVVPVDFPNTCPMKIVSIFYRIIARYGRDIYTLTQYFPNQQWCNKSTYDLVESRMIFNLIYLSSI